MNSSCSCRTGNWMKQRWWKRNRVWAPPSSGGSSSSSADTNDEEAPVPAPVPVGYTDEMRLKRRARTLSSRGLQEADAEVDAELATMAANAEWYKKKTIFWARLLIMTVFTCAIVLLTVIIWRLYKQYTSDSLESLAVSLRSEILQRPLNRMWSILNVTLDTTTTQVNLAEYAISRFPSTELSITDQAQLYGTMNNVSWRIFSSQKTVVALTVLFTNGITQSFVRDLATGKQFYKYCVLVNGSHDNGGSLLINRSPADFLQNMSKDSFQWYNQPIDNVTGKPMGGPISIPPYNISEDFSGISLLKHGDTSWRVTVHDGYDTPFLSSGSPVIHPQTGEVVAVTGITQALTSVSGLMKDLASLHSGTIYLTDSEGRLLASSTSSPLLRNTSYGASLVWAEESSNRIISTSAQWLKKSYGNGLVDLNSVHRDNVVLEEKRHYVDTFFLNLTQLPVLAVIVTPRSAVMGRIDQKGHMTLLAVVGTGVVALLGGWGLIYIFLRGVSNEMKKSVVIAQIEQRKAEKSSSVKSQFLANMSHELRTPMAAIMGLLDLLCVDENMTNDQLESVTQIQDCSKALLRLLNNILDLSKVESGKLVLEENEFNLRRELENLVDMFCVPENEVEIVLDIADDVPLLLKGDSDKTVQIFTNLISNSMKFTHKGHIVVRGYCDNTKSEGSARMSGLSNLNNQWVSKVERGQNEQSGPSQEKICIWFEVDDTGCGIDPMKWETVFDSFVQEDLSTTRMYGGTGLGLCIVRSLVRKMGGDIKVASKEGPGTLLRLNLWFRPSPSPESNAPQNFKNRYNPMLASETFRQSRILFSVPSDIMRTKMSRWMREAGLRVSEASTWDETVAKLQEMVHEHEAFPKLHPLVILDVDLVLNDLANNLEVMKKYHEKGVLIGWVLSHRSSSMLKAGLRDREFSSVVNKPMYKSKLLQLLSMVTNFDDYSNASFCDPEQQKFSSTYYVGGNSPGREELEPPKKLSPSETEHRLRSVSIGEPKLDRISNEHPRKRIGQERHSLDEISRYQLETFVKPLLLDLAPAETVATGSEGDGTSVLQGTPGIREGFAPSLETNNEMTRVDSGTREVSLNGHMAERFMGTQERNGMLGVSDTQAHDRSMCKDGYHRLPAGSHENSHDVHLEVEGKTHHDVCKRTPDCGVTIRGKAPSPKLENSSFSLSGEFTHRTGTSKPKPDAEVAANDAPLLKPVIPSRGNPRKQIQLSPSQPIMGIRVLLAEDTPVLRVVTTKYLEKLGAIVTQVNDGIQAVNALTKILDVETGGQTRELKYPDPALVPFDLVLMDLQMPGMDGYGATKIIREAEKGTGCHVPIVALTAHAMSDDKDKCIRVGMDAYLTKPIDRHLLGQTIVEHTLRHREAA